MSLRRFPLTNRKAEADQSSLENDHRPSIYTSNLNVTTAPSHTLAGRDSVGQPDENESSLTDTIGIAEKSKVETTNYIYYRIYAEDGAIPSKTSVTAGDPFLGRIKARSVPPPRTVIAVKRSITKVENIESGESASLFLTLYSQSPMDDADKIIFLNGIDPGSTPQEPLALVAKISDSERSALEFEGRSAAEPDTMSPEIRYVYYLLYDDYEMASKVAINPEEPSLGRIRADSVPPPHSPASIKRCISRVEGNPALALAYADLFEDTSCDTPLKEGHISNLRTDGPGLNPNEPMAIVLRLPIPNRKYLIKNRAAGIYWYARSNPIKMVYFWPGEMKIAKERSYFQWDITNDADGNISMTSPYAPSSWVGANMTGSTVPVPWRLIPADGKSFYLTTDMNRFCQNPRVPAAQENKGSVTVPGSMATLKEGDQWLMWEFIRI